MKFKRLAAFILAATMLVLAVPFSAFAAYEAPSISTVEKNLTDANEGLVFESDFEGATLSTTEKEGTQNATITMSGAEVKTGEYYSSHTIRDYWVSDGYRNIFTDGSSIIRRAHEKKFVAPISGKNDDNNCFDVTVKNAPVGQDFVISMDVTMFADGLSGAIGCYAFCNNATTQIKTPLLIFNKDGTLTVGSKNTAITKLAKGDSANLTIHVKITDPDPANASDKGSIVFDGYVDGKLVVENACFITATDQARISKVDRGNANVSKPENNTGLSTDYKLTYVRLIHSNGTVAATDENGNSLGANGQDLLSLDALRMYYSDTCYETFNTVKDLTFNYTDGGYSVTAALDLDEEILANENALVRFTSPAGDVTKLAISELVALDGGIYTATFNLKKAEYSGEFMIELLDGAGNAYPVYENGKTATSVKSSVKALEAELYNFSASIMPVYGARRAIVSLTFDDSVYPTALLVNEMCKKYGMQASMMMWCTNIKNATTGSYVNADMWSALFAEGYLEPQNHSMSHLDLRTNTDAGVANQSQENYKTQILDSKTLLESYFPDYDFLTYAIPFGNMSTEAKNYALQYHYALRGVSSSGIQSTDPGIGLSNGTWGLLYSPGVVIKDSEGNVVSEADQLAALKKRIDDTVEAGGWYLPFIHRVGDESGAEMSAAVTDAYFAYIDAYQESGDVWVATFSDAVKYIRERQNTTTSVRYEAGDVYLKLTMASTTADGLALPTDVFNHPLTVKVEVPSMFKTVSYTLGGKAMIAETFTENGVTYAYVDAIPNGEEVKLHGIHSYDVFEKIDQDTHKKICECGAYVTEKHTDSGFGFCKLCQVDLAAISLVINNDLAMRFYVDVLDPDIIKDSALSLKITMNDETFIIDEYEMMYDYYTFTFDGIGPHQVGETFDAELLIDGKCAVADSGFSVEQYCKDLLEIFYDDEALIPLIHDLLTYARAAEKYMFGESTVASDMTLTPSTLTPTEEDNVFGLTGNEDSDLYVYSAGVRFDSTVSIFFKVYAESTDFTVDIYDAATDTLVSFIGAETDYKNGYYNYSIVSILALDFDRVFTVTLKNASGDVVSNFDYSVNTYAYYMADGDSAMSELALALYRYGKSAKAYSIA